MRIGGVYVGLGIGDESPEIRNIKAFMRKKFSYAARLADTNVFDQEMVAAVADMQGRYNRAGKLPSDKYVPGVINVETKFVMGYLKRPVAARPVIYTVEGHMSNMWVGPCAETARVLESEGVCKWQPVGYDSVSLPFNNKSGKDELRRLLGDRNLLPAGTPWAMCIYSQGGIIGSSVWLEDILPPTGQLHWRLKDWRATLAFGNPYREKDVVAEWVPDPPLPGTQGISHERLSNTPANWKEIARRGDLYAENESSGDAGEHKTAIYQAVQNRWSGHPDSLLSQMIEIIERPLPEIIAMFQAIISGAMFLGNMAPHNVYNLGPGIDFLRRRLTDKG